MTEDANDLSLPEVPAGLFKDVKYYFIGKIPKKIEKLLNAGGARRDAYMSEILTHCIADEDDDEVTEAKELFQLAVVKSEWVTASVECGTLLPTNVFDPDSKRSIFKGVTICPSQISAKDNKVMWALVTSYGGQYQTLLNHRVTHLVTTSVKSVKYDLAQKHSDRIKIVTPDWVTESVSQRSRLNESRHHPRLLADRPEPPPTATATTTAVVEDIEMKQEVPVPPPSCSVPAQKPAPPRVVPSPISDIPVVIPRLMMTPTRPANSRQLAQQTTAQRLKESVIGVNRQDVVSERPQLVQAPLPTLPIVRPVIARQTLPLSLPPTVPSPRQVAPPPRQIMRNIANNTGSEIRMQKNSPRANSAKINQIVSNLTQHVPRHVSPARASIGAMYPPPAAAGKMYAPPDIRMHYGHDPGEHIPDDACLLGCVFYITDYQKYLELTTLDTWKQAINQYGGQVDDSYSNRITHVLCEHQKSDVFQLALRDGKRLVTAHWLNDCLLMRKMRTPWLALHFPYVFGKEKPFANQIICVTNFVDDERDRIKHMIMLLGAKYTGYMSRANSVLVAKRPGGKKYEKAMEWRLPVVNVQWLNDVILGDLSALKLPLQPRYAMLSNDIGFSVDMQRVMHLLEGWKIPVKISKETWKKFQSSQILKSNAQVASFAGSLPPGLGNDGSAFPQATSKRRSDSGYDALPEKRARHAGPTSAELEFASSTGPVVIFTGIPNSRTTLLASEVERIGGKVAPSSSRFCTHLVTVSILRTIKFLTALSHVKHIVTPEWVEQSSRANRFLDESCFLVRDENTETSFSFKLYESLRRARSRKLFQDMMFYLTPEVKPNRSVLVEMIESAGGKVIKTLPPYSSVSRFVNIKGDPTFIVVSCENDMYLCSELVHRNISIHSSEFVITGIMRQEVDYLTHRL